MNTSGLAIEPLPTPDPADATKLASSDETFGTSSPCNPNPYYIEEGHRDGSGAHVVICDDAPFVSLAWVRGSPWFGERPRRQNAWKRAGNDQNAWKRDRHRPKRMEATAVRGAFVRFGGISTIRKKAPVRSVASMRFGRSVGSGGPVQFLFDASFRLVAHRGPTDTRPKADAAALKNS